MIHAPTLLANLQQQQRKLEQDLRQQLTNRPELEAHQQEAWQAARSAGRSTDTFSAWLEPVITQAAVAWLLACTFVRFCEDNGLLPTPRLAGRGPTLRRALDAMQQYFAAHPTHNERHWMEHVFDEVGQLPALAGLFDRGTNPLFPLPPSYEAARDLLAFWQQVDPETGELVHDFTDPDLSTRFLGDLYQDLSEAARKRYALLQTPEFVEAFILDRTLTPALKQFGLEGIRLIDPTCGSGHFLLGAFARLLAAWQRQAPGLDVREQVGHVLGSIYGVDINPFAVAIARFRLLLAALQACGIQTLKEAPAWQINLTTGDSLLHGPRFGQGELGLEETGVDAEFQHVYETENHAELHRILGQRYHAVVGNPPYITASDAALNTLYRIRYSSCYRQFSLGVPFTERFFQLAQPAGNSAPAGFVGLITTNSFMKREFGKKLIEEWLPRQDLTHVIDTSGAYIPGHGTPTVILLGRNQPPVAPTVRAVLGIRGEPSTPTDPTQGLVWQSIVNLIDRPGAQNEYVSAANLPRERLAAHPWSLQGGVAPDVLEQLETSAKDSLGDHANEIGFSVVTREDDVYLISWAAGQRNGIPTRYLKPLVAGDEVRDWCLHNPTTAIWPYDEETLVASASHEVTRFLWPFRTQLSERVAYGKSQIERGLTWFEFSMFFTERYRRPLSITFAFVATHNHFLLDRGGKVFKQSAPIIKLPPEASEDVHLGLLGLLNSSTACFWMKQVFYNKGMGDEIWADRFEHDSTKLEAFPLGQERPTELARQLDTLAQQHSAHLPAALADELPLITRADLDAYRTQAEALRSQMIALQEELDWWCYRAYGLLHEDLTFTSTPPPLQLGERAFEIVLARRMATGEVQTRWFERHGSTPITEPPAHWPANYRALVERRMALIADNDWFDLLERPEYKRRWQHTRWPEQERAALRSWLLARLEGAAYWPESALRTSAQLAVRAEVDADFQAVGALYTGQPAFDVAALVTELLQDETVPAAAALRYKASGLRKRADWEHTWELQRQEDALDAEVARHNPRAKGESETDWQARIAPLQEERKATGVGTLAVPPKYSKSDFLHGSYWSLRGKLDVPKERFFSLPDPANPGALLYGWAGWNPAQRVQAIASACLHAEQQAGAEPEALIPLLAAVGEALPWVLQWHNDIDPDTDVRLGDYFSQWLAQELSRHGWTRQTLADWRSAAPRRGRRRRTRT